MNTKREHVILSLSEPMGLLKDRLTQYYTYLITNGAHPNKVSKIIEFNELDFIIPLIHEIFNGIQFHEQFDPITPSTTILMSLGIDRNNATEISRQVFTLIVDIISANVPNACFNPEEEYRYTVCNEGDLYVSDAYMKERDQY